MTTHVVSTDTGLDALLTLLHLQGVAADRDQLRHRQGAVHLAQRTSSAAPNPSA